MQVICVIPARLQSTRFPRKVLADIQGQTMIERVWRQARQCPEFSDVYVAVDSEEVAEEVERFGGKWHMTSPSCINGTHRLIEFVATSGVVGDVFVNWQADEPFLHPGIIADLLQGVGGDGSIWTVKKEAAPHEVHNPNVAKVVTDARGRALYFSRSPIPFDREGRGVPFYKHIGLYAYTREALSHIASLPQTHLSETESLEQLKFLEHGLSIQVYPTRHDSFEINTQEDLCKILSIMI